MAGPRRKPKLPPTPGHAKVIKGDLVVKRDLAFKGSTYVHGDVIVGGVIEEYLPGDALMATGSIRAKGIKSGTTIYAGKRVEAEVVFIDVVGKVGAVDGIHTELVVLNDADCEIEGEVFAKQEITLSLGNTAPLQKLQKLLAPEAFGLIDDSVFDYTNLMGTIARGGPWRAADATRGGGMAAKKSKSGSVQYFELVDGSSSKFWEISIAGSNVTTRYGKIGTPGQSTLKDFGDSPKAQNAALKLVMEKTKKGYEETDPPAAGAAAAAPAKKKKAAAAPAPAKKKSGGGRLFELSEGSSNKFWEISIAGSKVTTRYGKIGTSGQTTVKDFGAKAQAEYDKLIREKTKKGYAEK